MSVERTSRIYGLPERPPGQHVDVSRLSQGNRVARLLEGTNFRRRDAASTFTTTPGIFDQDSVTILLAGTLGRAGHTFSAQIPFLQELSTKPVWVDYSNARASQEMLRAQLLDFADSLLVEEREVNLVGVSLGADVIMNLDIQEPDAEGRISRQVLAGPLFSREDFKDAWPHNLVRNVGRIINNEPVVKFVMPYARRFIKVEDDPLLAPQHEEIAESRNRVTDLALAERTLPILKSGPIEEHGKITTIPTLLIFWENDESRPERRQVIADSFTNPVVMEIPGNHGWMLSSADYINPALEEFLFSREQALKAAV